MNHLSAYFGWQVLTDKQRILLAACQQRWPSGSYNPNGNGWSDPNKFRLQLVKAVRTGDSRSPGGLLSWKLHRNGKPTEPQYRAGPLVLHAPDCSTLGCLLKRHWDKSNLLVLPQTIIIDIDRFFKTVWKPGAVRFPFELNLCPFIGEGGVATSASCRLWLKNVLKNNPGDEGKFSLLERGADGRWFRAEAGQGYTQVSSEYVKGQSNHVCSLLYVQKTGETGDKPSVEEPQVPQCSPASTLRQHNAEDTMPLMQCRRTLTKAQSTVSDLQRALAAQVASVASARAENDMLSYQIQNLTTLLQTVLTAKSLK